MTTARRAWRTRGAARAMPLLSLRQATRHDLPSFHGHFGEFYSSPRLCLLFTATRPTVPVPSHGTRAEKALEFRFCCQRSDWTGRRSISGERMQAALVRPAETQRPAHKQVAGRVRLLRALTRTRGCRRPCGLALQHQPWTSGLSQGRRVAARQGSCRAATAPCQRFQGRARRARPGAHRTPGSAERRAPLATACPVRGRAGSRGGSHCGRGFSESAGRRWHQRSIRWPVADKQATYSFCGARSCEKDAFEPLPLGCVPACAPLYQE